MTYALIIIGVLFVGYFVVLPLIAARMFSASASPTAQYCQSSRSDLPPMYPAPPRHAEAFFDLIEEELAEIEFRPLAWVMALKVVSNSDTYIALFERPSTRDYAAAIVCVSMVQPANEIRNYSVNFACSSPDKYSWETTNVVQPAGFPKLPGKTTYRFPGLGDLRLLYEMHAALSRRDGAGTQRATAGPDWVGDVVNDMVREYQKIVACGYYYLDDSGTRYRLRLRAIPYCVIGLLWPINRIRLRLLRRKALALLASEGHHAGYEPRKYEADIAKRMLMLWPYPPTHPEFD